jgi:hypothetical protein
MLFAASETWRRAEGTLVAKAPSRLVAGLENVASDRRAVLATVAACTPHRLPRLQVLGSESSQISIQPAFISGRSQTTRSQN